MAPLDQSFTQAYSTESTIDPLQPIEAKSEKQTGPVPAPHANFRTAKQQKLAKTPREDTSATEAFARATSPPARATNVSSKRDRSSFYAAWTTSVTSNEVFTGSDLFDAHDLEQPSSKHLTEAERQIAIDDDVDLPADDDPFQHDSDQPVSIPMPSRNTHPTLRAELEVDRFAWTAQVKKLASVEKTGRLVDILEGTCTAGDNVIALAGQQSGSGVSTLLLVAARGLASAGLRVAVVDANFKHPALATMLGIAPPAGWESVLAQDCPLSEVLVESLEDRLVLLPLAGDGAVDEELIHSSQLAIAETLSMMRLDFDVVLVDAGAADDVGNRSDVLTSDAIEILDVAGSSIDAVVCVCDGRAEPVAQSVARPRRKSCSIRQLGIVENFTL